MSRIPAPLLSFLGTTLLLSVGCPPELPPVAMDGRAVLLPDRADPAGGATVAVRGLNELGIIGTAVADSDGVFEVRELLAGRPIFTVLSRDGDVPTSYSGFTGIYDFSVPDGRAGLMTGSDLETRMAPWIEFAPEVLDGWAPEPDVPGSGGAVFGATFEFMDGLDSLPPLPGVEIELYNQDGDVFGAHYSGPGEEGEVPDPDANSTYVDGRFWLFGLPEGQYEGRAIFSREGQTYVCPFWAWVPEDGVALLESLQLGAC